MTTKKYHSDVTQETYHGEVPARVCMFVPGGQRWFDSHEEAVAVILEDYPEATHVKRWQENGLQYEDYKNPQGGVVRQLEFAGPAVLTAGFIYE